MKESDRLVEDGIVVGNVYDKYGTNNPIAKILMNGFENSLSNLVEIANPRSIHEIGCGEGYWVLKWNKQNIVARGSDFSSQIIKQARGSAIGNKLSPDIFKQCSIYEVDASRDSADLIVCCEVLEHLEDPVEGLKSLCRITNKYVVISVPREPIWRILNVMRGKYLSSLGNTPGHIQHWSRRGIIKLVSEYFDIVEIKMPFPWTMLLCKVR